MTFWPTFWATMWGALGGAAVGAAGSWLFALDLARRDREARKAERAEAQEAQQRQQDAEYNVAIRREWSALSVAFVELAASLTVAASKEVPDERVASHAERETAALSEAYRRMADAAAVAREADAEVIGLLMDLVIKDQPGDPNKRPRLYETAAVLGALAVAPISAVARTRVSALTALQSLLVAEHVDPVVRPKRWTPRAD